MTLVQHHLAAETDLLKDFIECFWDSHEGKIRLCGVLDIQLRSSVRNLPKEFILEPLRRELTGARSLPIKIGEYKPDSNLIASRAMRRFMRLLQNLYDGLGESKTVERLRDEIDALSSAKSPYGGDFGLVILAGLDGNFVGGACIRFDETVGMCEVRYLWVDPEYRGHGVGRQIIEEAIRLGNGSFTSDGQIFKSNGVYVEILDKILNTATELLYSMNFETSSVPLKTKGRTILEYTAPKMTDSVN